MNNKGTSADTVSNATAGEPDTLNGFTHPRMQPHLFGHKQAAGELLNAYRSRRLHHAWLLTGPEGIGKATFAYQFARTLLVHGDAPAATPADLNIGEDHPVFRQVCAMSSPNLLVIRRPWQEKTKRWASEITVGEARRLRHFFGHTAASGAWRVVIVDRADDLNSAAANALLKNLEEPPARCVFLLVCSSPGQLPVTVRSRCRTLRFGPLDDQDLAQAVESAFALANAEFPGSASVRMCLPLAQGSVRRTLGLLEAGGTELHARLLELLNSLPTLDHVGLHALADDITAASAEASYDLFFDLTGEILGRIVLHAATGTGAIGDEAGLAKRIQAPATLAHFAGLWETIWRAKSEADALNLDRKNLVLGTFFRIEQTAREVLA